MWDPSILWRDGKYYTVMMYAEIELPDKWRNGFLASSADGVHWENEDPVNLKAYEMTL